MSNTSNKRNLEEEILSLFHSVITILTIKDIKQKLNIRSSYRIRRILTKLQNKGKLTLINDQQVFQYCLSSTPEDYVDALRADTERWNIFLKNKEKVTVSRMAEILNISVMDVNSIYAHIRNTQNLQKEVQNVN